MDLMKKLEIQPFVKYVVLKTGLFETEVIDEANFGLRDSFAIMQFKRKYTGRDDCMIVEIEM